VVAHDPHAPVATEALGEALSGADAVVVATNHSEFSDGATLAALAERTADNCLVVDPWNALGGGQVFSTVSEAVDRSRAQADAAPTGLP
jgi:UDP-N-acetyl-D-mannosaminuronic acid dehydrogenase